MLTSWYTLIVGLLITINGIIFLIFTNEQFKQPNWYVGLMLIAGVLGIIFGIIGVTRKRKEGKKEEEPPMEQSQ